MADVDTLIRERSGGKKSLDDFARKFFGVHDGQQITETYTFEELIAALNRVEPYDWASFLKASLDAHGPSAPLGGLARGGYRLVYTDAPNAIITATETHGRVDLSRSIGLTVGKDGKLDQVAWDSPAFRAGLAPGATLLAVNGSSYDGEALKVAVTAAKSAGAINLVVKSEGGVAPVQVLYKGGLRYPHLEPITGSQTRLDQILTPRR